MRLENYWPVSLIPNANPVVARTRILASPRTKSDAEGRFEIVKPPRQRAKSTPFGVRADLDGYTCIEAPSGQVAGVRDLRVVMRAQGRLEGSLRLPDPAPIGKLEVRVTHLDPGGGGGEERCAIRRLRRVGRPIPRVGPPSRKRQRRDLVEGLLGAAGHDSRRAGSPTRGRGRSAAPGDRPHGASRARSLSVGGARRIDAMSANSTEPTTARMASI